MGQSSVATTFATTVISADHRGPLMGEGNTEPRILSGSLEDTLECFFSVWTLKRLKGVGNEDNRKIGFKPLIFLARENQPPPQHHLFFGGPPPQHHLFARMISSSASPICCDCLLSITYFGQMPSSASPILARCPPQHHLFWPDALLSITYTLIAARDLLLSITYFLGGPLPQHHLFSGDLLLSITYVLVRVCCDALQPFSQYSRAPIGTFYLSDELHSRQ
jgi:hypothetical protein